MGGQRGSQGRFLTGKERAFCNLYDRTLAEHRRAGLRAAYALACAFGKLKAAADVRPRLVETCAEQLLRDRSTLVRFGLLPLIKSADLHELIALGDSRGYPPTIWDLMHVAKVPRALRVGIVVERLAAREAKEKAKWAGA